MVLELRTVWLLLMAGRMCSGVVRRGPHHPRGEDPVLQHHHHYKPKADTPLTHDAELLHDTQHLAEDTQALTQEALAAMSTEELEFHYFSSHDFDKNNKLDGLELLKAVYHTMEHHDEETESPLDVDKNDIAGYIDLVDKTLKSDDTDGDGYVSYAEYRAVRVKRSREEVKKPDHRIQEGNHGRNHQDKDNIREIQLDQHNIEVRSIPEKHPGYQQIHENRVKDAHQAQNLPRQGHGHKNNNKVHNHEVRITDNVKPQQVPNDKVQANQVQNNNIDDHKDVEIKKQDTITKFRSHNNETQPHESEDTEPKSEYD